MAITDIDWGTVTLTNGETEVVGVGTSFLADEIRDGDTFVFVDGADGFQSPIVESVQSNTELTLRQPWPGPTLTAATYTLRYQWDSSRVSAMSRRLIMLLDNGNLTAFSQLTGPGIAVFTGPHSMEVRPFSDFVNGVRFDVQVDTLVDRDAYDGQVEGFAVLVSDVGDGRSAVFSKNTNTVSDWSDAAYITGPVGDTGPYTDITVGPVTTLPYGQPASVDVVQVDPETIRLDFSIPKGQDGTGTGDMVGPSSSTVNGFVGFADTGGKQTKQLTSAQATAGLDVFEISKKGLVPAPEGGDEGKFLNGAGEWKDLPVKSIELALSQVANAVSDIDQSALFVGSGVSDNFRNLAYVDVAGSTNLDTSEVGFLKPARSSTMIPRTDGTAIGNMTVGGGIAAGFDGVTNQADADSARGSVNTAGYTASLGKDWGSGNSHVISSAVIYVPNNNTLGGSSGARNVKLQGSSNNSTWVDLYTTSNPVGGSNGSIITLGPISSVTGYRYHRVVVDVDGSNAARIAELQFYEAGDLADLDVESTSFTISNEVDSLTGFVSVVSADTPNADFFTDVSRDGGVTWVNAGLSYVYSQPSGLDVYAFSSDLSNEPSGSDIRWRFRTENQSDTKFDAIYLAFDGLTDSISYRPAHMVKFGFATDVHYSDKDAVSTRYYRDGLPKLVDAVSHWTDAGVDFVVLNGDTIDNNGETSALALSDLASITNAVESIDTYYVLGNHCQDALTKSQFLAAVGQDDSYYSFDAGGVHFVVLDANYGSDSDASSWGAGTGTWNVNYIPPSERSWLEDDLDSTTLPVVVFCHYRLDNAGDYSVNNESAVRSILEQHSDKVLAVFSGHNHINATSEINGIRYCSMAALTEGPYPTTAYATVTVTYDQKIIVEGSGSQWSFTI